MSLDFQATPIGTEPAGDLGTRVATLTVGVAPALRPAFTAHDAAEANLERLFANRALCVTTGQQPGLLTGPLYTLYKALTAVALARSLEERFERPVVPVFWTAGDDHDFAEANHVHVLTLHNEIEPVTLRERDPAAPLVPLYQEPVGGAIGAVLDAVQRATPETEFRPAVLAWLERHYRPEHDLATAFAGAVAELLGPYGLVVFRPSHGAAKRAMADHLLEALREAPALDRALAARAHELRAAGGSVPVAVGEGATNIMIEGTLGRDRLVLDGTAYVARRSNERWTLAALEAVGRDAPTRLSPNVLLRPVVEAALLPTVAYVAGPGELAYLPQCEPLYRALGVVPQATFPRWSGRIIESKIAKVLEKYQLQAADLDGPEGQLERRLAQEEMPPNAAAALAALRKALGSEYGRLERAAVAVDPTLKKSVQSARNTALAGVADVEKRIVGHLKKQDEILQQQLAKARHNLFPLGRPQERVFSSVPFLIRYGPGFLDDAFAAVRARLQALERATPRA